MENQIIEEKLGKFFQKYPLHHYKKGEILLRPGESCSSVCFIKSGYVRLFSETKNGKETTINLLSQFSIYRSFLPIFTKKTATILKLLRMSIFGKPQSVILKNTSKRITKH